MNLQFFFFVFLIDFLSSSMTTMSRVLYYKIAKNISVNNNNNEGAVKNAYAIYTMKKNLFLKCRTHLGDPFFWGEERIEIFNKGHIWMHLGVTQSKQCRFI